MALFTSYPKDEYTLLRRPINVAIRRVLESGVYVLGREVTAFEEEFAEYIGLQHCIGVGNGTEALFLALTALNIGPGDEVITTPMTAAYTAFAIMYTGATPVFVDVRPDTYALDEAQIEQVMTKRTKAIIPVHIFGQPANIVAIMRLAKKHKLKVIEDCCQAHGAKVGTRTVGTFGDIACFSFYPTKNLGAIGDGGAIATNNRGLAQKLRLLHNGHQTSKYYHTAVGHNSRLDEIQAAILRVKLQHLDQFISKRQAIAAQYDRLLAQREGMIKPFVAPNVRHVFHLYVVLTKQRDALQRRLAREHIITQVHYPWPLHTLPAFAHLPRRYSLPVSERMAQQALSLPMYPGLKTTDLRRICQIVNLT